MIRRHIVLVAAAVFALCSPLSGQEHDSWGSAPELAEMLAERGHLPALAVGWAHLDEAPHVGVSGVRWLGGEPVEVSDRFHLGSLTKSITATAIARLVEQGILHWTDRIEDVLPDLDMQPVYRDVQLQELLRHRGRIAPDLDLAPEEIARLNALPGAATQQRLAYVAEVLMRPPLEAGYAYSNAGYAVAAAMAERASGRTWTALVQEEVFDALGLNSCGFGWPATAARPDQPRGHYGSWPVRKVQPLDEFELGAFISPAGNTYCTVEDLTRFGLAHLAGLAGRDGFLKSSTVAELHRIPQGGAPYAAGWGVDPVSGQHRHDGSVGTFYSYLVVDPTVAPGSSVVSRVCSVSRARFGCRLRRRLESQTWTSRRWSFTR